MRRRDFLARLAAAAAAATLAPHLKRGQLDRAQEAWLENDAGWSWRRLAPDKLEIREPEVSTRQSSLVTPGGQISEWIDSHMPPQTIAFDALEGQLDIFEQELMACNEALLAELQKSFTRFLWQSFGSTVAATAARVAAGLGS